MTPTDKIIEARARAIIEAQPSHSRLDMDEAWVIARATLAADTAAGFWSAPMEATEEMWDGPARDIMFWLRMGQPTPRKLFDHLGLLEKEIPDWMHKETELKALDHVVSKGTCCVLIYNAMRDAFLRDRHTQEGT